MTTLYLIPGPTKVTEKVSQHYLHYLGSPDLSPDFFDLYARTQTKLQTIFNTKNDVAIMTGEGMLALWAALKSTIKPKDKVLSICNGLFGYGISEMAKQLGAEVKCIEYPFNKSANDNQRIEKAITEFRPKMITCVHCETPTGVINPIREIGELKSRYKVPLFYVDAVASLGGMPVDVDASHIDLCLGASQKVFSAPADLCFLSVSETAWDFIESRDYQGYDALKPFRRALKNHYFPYTPHWQGIAALEAAMDLLLEEGLPKVFDRHKKVAAYCRESVEKIGYQLFPESSAIFAPTVSAIYVPENIAWNDLNSQFQAQGLYLGGNYGYLKGKVFRVGHMGSQASQSLVEAAIAIMKNKQA